MGLAHYIYIKITSLKEIPFIDIPLAFYFIYYF